MEVSGSFECIAARAPASSAGIRTGIMEASDGSVPVLPLTTLENDGYLARVGR